MKYNNQAEIDAFLDAPVEEEKEIKPIITYNNQAEIDAFLDAPMEEEEKLPIIDEEEEEVVEEKLPIKKETSFLEKDTPETRKQAAEEIEKLRIQEEEGALQQPLFDPIDIIPGGPGLAKIGGKGVSAANKWLAKKLGKTGGGLLSKKAQELGVRPTKSAVKAGEEIIRHRKWEKSLEKRVNKTGEYVEAVKKAKDVSTKANEKVINLPRLAADAYKKATVNPAEKAVISAEKKLQKHQKKYYNDLLKEIKIISKADKKSKIDIASITVAKTMLKNNIKDAEVILKGNKELLGKLDDYEITLDLFEKALKSKTAGQKTSEFITSNFLPLFATVVGGGGGGLMGGPLGAIGGVVIPATVKGGLAWFKNKSPKQINNFILKATLDPDYASALVHLAKASNKIEAKVAISKAEKLLLGSTTSMGLKTFSNKEEENDEYFQRLQKHAKERNK